MGVHPQNSQPVNGQLKAGVESISSGDSVVDVIIEGTLSLILQQMFLVVPPTEKELKKFDISLSFNPFSSWLSAAKCTY